MSAVSLGGVSIIEEDDCEFDDDSQDGDSVLVDDDDGKTITSATSSQNGWRHPASVLSSRMGSAVRRVVWCNQNMPQRADKTFCNYTKYKALTERSAGSRNISVTNVGVYESEEERLAREARESKKRWVSSKDFATDQTAARCKDRTSKTRAAWGEYKSHLHDGEWEGPFKGFRGAEKDKSKFMHPDGQGFQTVVYAQSDARKDIAEQWYAKEEDIDPEFQDSFRAA